MSAAVPVNLGDSRIGSLDVLRGGTVLAMILVNNPGSWAPGAIWPPLRHAAWHGCTPTDLIFPFFLFIVGASMALVEERSSGAGSPWQVTVQAARRASVLVGLGLFLNFFGQWSLGELRVTGVLQRIGVCYFLVSMVLLVLGRWVARADSASAEGPQSVASSSREEGQKPGESGEPLRRWQRAAVLIIVPALLVLHTALLALVLSGFGTGGGTGGVVPMRWPDTIDSSANAQQSIDDAIIGRAHLYKPKETRGVTDPEGLLGTVTAAATVAIGFGLMSRWRRHTRHATELATESRGRRDGVGHPTLDLALAGAGLAVLGYASAGFPSAANWFSHSPAWALPLNKPLWTGSYVLWTGGLAALALAALLGVEAWWGRGPGRRGPGWAMASSVWMACAATGKNAILVFVGSGVLARVLAMCPSPTGAEGQNAKVWVVGVLQSATGSLLAASSLFAVGNVVLWIGVAVMCDRRRWYWKV